MHSHHNKMAVARATMRPAAARAHARVPSSCICRPAVPAARPRPGACCAVDTTEATTAKVLEEPEAAAGGVAGGGGAAAAAAAGDPAAAADDLAASRRYTSFLPPFFSRATALEALGEGLWGVTQVCGARPSTEPSKKTKYESRANKPSNHHSPLTALSNRSRSSRPASRTSACV
jgi:hypothetical protein